MELEDVKSVKIGDYVMVSGESLVPGVRRVGLALALVAMGFTPAWGQPVCWTVPITNLVRVIDGDTFVADLAVWHSLTTRVSVRLRDVDTPELRGGTAETRAQAEKAKGLAEAWLRNETGQYGTGPIQVATCGTDSFGRIVGRVYREGSSLSAVLLAAGLAR